MGFAYVADTFNSCIRAVELATGTVRTIAGLCGVGGHVDAPPVDPRNESIVYVSDVECSDDGPLGLVDSCKPT